MPLQAVDRKVLEGERGRVNALYRRICADKRHQDVELRHYEEINERRIGQWSMALVHLSVDDPRVRMQHPDFDPCSTPDPQVMQQMLDLLETGHPICMPASKVVCKGYRDGGVNVPGAPTG